MTERLRKPTALGMGVEEIRIAFNAEPTLAEELALFDEDDVYEFMNLTEAKTGVPRVIKVTTVMGSHGPRVKYYLGRARADQPSFSVSIGSEPRVLASSLGPRDTDRNAPAVMDWVRLNHQALSDFWFNGHDLEPEELNAFAARLERVEPRRS